MKIQFLAAIIAALAVSACQSPIIPTTNYSIVINGAAPAAPVAMANPSRLEQPTYEERQEWARDSVVRLIPAR